MQLKAGTDVKVEDELVIRFGQKRVTVKVTGLSEHASKENAKNMYELIKEERVQPSAQSEEVQSMIETFKGGDKL